MMRSPPGLIPQSGMKKYVLIRAREDLTRKAFSDYWSGPHARLLSGLPEFWVYATRYLQNHVADDPCFPNPRGWAGVVENWQSDAIHEGRSFASEPVYGQVVTPDERNFLQPDHSIALVAASRVVVDGPASGLKLIEPYRTATTMDREAGLSQWRDSRVGALRRSGKLYGGSTCFIENRVRAGSACTLEGMPAANSYDAIGEYWFESRLAAEAFAGAAGASELLSVSVIEIPRS